MDKNGLDKVINRFVVRKYPWIKDYQIVASYDAPNEYYEVRYIVSDNWKKNDKEDLFLEDLREVENLTETLFKTLGFETNQKFQGVDFLEEKDWGHRSIYSMDLDID